ncbi:MAG TPA: ABC transporter permease [Thermomicrobiales bacterium]|nr:ABC transporter permease [Thermomicrobiales bacterium]
MATKDAALDFSAAGADTLADQLILGRAPSRPSMLTAIRRQRLALTGLIIIILFTIVALFGRYVAPHGPTEQFSKHILEAPSQAFPLGTDEFGRDILTRMLYGARVSFTVGFASVLLAGSVGVVLGLIAGYLGGWVDNLLVLLMDVIWAFPAVLLAIVFVTALGNSLENAMLAIALVYMPTFMRVVRGATLAVRETAYVEAALSTGVATPRILARHIFPNITAPLIVHASLNFAGAVLAEASLSFLGLGNKPPNPSWGSMVSSSYGFLQKAPWAAIFPGVAIALVVLGFNLLGDGLRDALDPRLRNATAKAER